MPEECREAEWPEQRTWKKQMYLESSNPCVTCFWKQPGRNAGLLLCPGQRMCPSCPFTNPNAQHSISSLQHQKSRFYSNLILRYAEKSVPEHWKLGNLTAWLQQKSWRGVCNHRRWTSLPFMCLSLNIEGLHLFSLQFRKICKACKLKECP